MHNDATLPAWVTGSDHWSVQYVQNAAVHGVINLKTAVWYTSELVIHLDSTNYPKTSTLVSLVRGLNAMARSYYDAKNW